VRITEVQREEGGLVEGQAFSDPPRPVFLSAGNNGINPRDNIFMRLHGYYGLLVNLKNGIIVGSVESNDAQHVDSSSLGPTLDGRLKPDLCAPGSSDYRPLSGFTIELGEIRLHAKPGSGASDIVWRWGRPHTSLGDWGGQGAFDLEDATLNAGVLRGETFGSFYTRVYWTRAEGMKAIDASQYEAFSIETRFERNSDSDAYHTPHQVDRKPLPLEHTLPLTWRIQWGDDQGRGYDRTRYVRYDLDGNREEWARIKYDFDEQWRGDISRLRVTPATYRGGIYTPSIRGGYTTTSGTSMASPAAAGVGAIALSQLVDQHAYDLETSAPSPALIRGLLIHTTRDLVRALPPPRANASPDTGFPVIYFKGPDFATGYGVVDAQAMSRLISAGVEHPRWYEGEISPDEELTFTLNVRETESPLKVTLVWDDPPGSTLTPPWESKLIHDLDLAVISPEGKAHGPWVLSPPPLNLETYTSGEDDLSLTDLLPARRCVADSLADLWPQPRSVSPDAELERTDDLAWAPHGNRRCLDDLNPLEHVLIEAPERGEYLIKVRGAHLGGGRQRFVLIASQSCAWTP
jgi:hypothetical protein